MAPRSYGRFVPLVREITSRRHAAPNDTCEPCNSLISCSASGSQYSKALIRNFNIGFSWNMDMDSAKTIEHMTRLVLCGGHLQILDRKFSSRDAQCRCFCRPRLNTSADVQHSPWLRQGQHQAYITDAATTSAADNFQAQAS